MAYYQIQKKGFLPRIKNLSITTGIIIANVLAYFVILISLSINSNNINYFALTPSLFLQGKYLWTIIAHMFSHVEPFHIFANMFSLWFIGRIAEKIIGRKRFFWLYIITGILAGAITAYLSVVFGTGFLIRIFGDPTIPMLGASGAIFGIAGLLATLIPFSRVYLMMGPLIAIIIEAILQAVIKNTAVLNVLAIIINIYIFIAIFSLLSFNPKNRNLSLPMEIRLWMLPFIAIIPLIVVGLLIPLPISNIAHLAGFVIGAIYGLYLRKKYKRKVNMLQSYFK